MGKVERFEDLRCWQAARELVKLVYLACNQGKPANDWETRGQTKRAALSTMNNIAEGFGRFRNKEFVRFLDISQASANEVKSITYALEDANYLPSETTIEIRNKAEEVKNRTLALIRYLRSNMK